ncbi:TetR/AcrR family transcriptional regulator [bacterium]|nr:TetR/AcrR family transcriptional regulator [bacterium]
MDSVDEAAPNAGASVGSDSDVVEPRQERSIESTDRLIEAATELFADRGYASTTLAAIGDRAGYSRGLVTTRFGNKENLAWAVASRAAQRWQDVLDDRRTATDGLGEILAFIVVSRDNMIEQPTARLVLERLYAETGSPQAPLHSRFQENLRTLISTVSDMCERGIDDGSIRRDLDTKQVAGLLIAQLRGIGYQWFLFPDLVEAATYHQLLLEQTQQWLTPSEKSHP